MAFHDSVAVGELELAVRISIKHEGVWLTGKVVGLALLGEDRHTVRVTLELADGRIRFFDRPPTCNVTIEWGDEKDEQS